MPGAISPAIHPTGAPRPPRDIVLRSVADTLEQLLSPIGALAATEDVSTLSALGRVTAAPLVAELDVPAADNAQMDGYALRAAEVATATVEHPVSLPIAGRIAAGDAPHPLAIGAAVRIFTGAWIPDGADAVVMQEDTQIDPASGRVSIFQRPATGQWIRRRGEDVSRGQTVLPSGTRLEPQHLGLAASIGAATLTVVRRPRVALFSTGDELAMPGEVSIDALKPGALFNSNRFTLRGLVESFGCDVVDLGIVPDTLAATRAALVQAAAAADVIVTSGGVSVGEEDHVRPAVDAEGRVDLWQIAIKPGKPLASGRVRDAIFVGLPGNPVSSFVTFLIFVRPLLLRLQGIAEVEPPSYRLVADFDWPKPDRRQEFLRVRVNAGGMLDLFAEQGSAVLTSTVWADGLVDNPAGRAIARGDLVRYLPFDGLLR